MEKDNKAQGDERLQVYEVGFHIVPIVSVDALPAEYNAIRSLIETNGGAIISEEAPKSRVLAYTLSRMRSGKREKFDHAFFGWVKFECSPETVGVVKQGMMKNENVLRYIIIKTVRENTLAAGIIKGSTGRGIVGPKEAEDAKTTGSDPLVLASVSPDPAKMSDEDIDKTIDDMVKE